MDNRIPCKNEGCKATILPSTAEKTGGICMPCFQKIKREEEEEYIRKNRKDINLYEGIINPVEVLKIMYAPKAWDPLKKYIEYPKSQEDIYISLTQFDISELKKYVIQLINNKSIDIVEEILLRLVCHTNSNIDECLEELIKKEHYYPGIIFKGTSQRIRDHLISRVEVDSENRNHILYALSWIGDQEVVQLFNKWHKHPPKWSSELYVKPETYSFEAGWKLISNGKREELFYNKCYPFEEREYIKEESVQIIKKQDEECPWCNSSLTVLFDLDLTNPILRFLNISGKRLKITTCHVCTCYGIVYSRFNTEEGSSNWYELNNKPAYLPNIVNPKDEVINMIKPWALSNKIRDNYYSSSWILETSSSQIGGHPTWIQDAEYPQCPECSNHMKLIGQLDCQDFEEYGEGIYYAFICEKCSIAATYYQQT